MTFQQIIKRFFEPVLDNLGMFMKALFGYFRWTLAPIVGVFLLEDITMALENGDKAGFFMYIIILTVFLLVYYILRFLLKDISRVVLSTKGIAIFYPKYINKFLVLDNTEIEKIGTGKLISIMTRGFGDRSRILGELFHQGISIIVNFAFTIYVLVKIGTLYAVIFVIFFTLIQILIHNMNKKVLLSRRKTNDIYNENSRSLVKIIMSKFEIMQGGRGDDEIQKLTDQMDDAYTFTKERSGHIELMFLLPEAAIYVLRIVMLLVLGLGILSGEYTFAMLVLFTGMLGLIDKSVIMATRLFKDVTKNFVTVEKLREIFDSIPVTDGYDKGENFVYKKGFFVLKNISFAYDEKNIFEEFSLKIEGGTKIAFVGESGGGKTTLIKLLAGFIKQDKGVITIDGQNLSKIKLSAYYKHIGYLTQDPSVFDGTIYENLVYALDYSPQQEELDTVIDLSKCGFIREFKKGVQTEIGEKGIRLSGGQKQRLAIAKIMLKNPSIILLDEPTSALDSINEEKINIALHNLFKGKTVIIAAHRLQTVKSADRILLLEQGKIIEDGTHNELVKKKGKYKKMLDLQSGF